MGRIDDIFGALRAEGRGALMPFVTAGYPSLESTAEVIPALETAGASIVEVGFPFSDPIADGPVIAAAMHEALSRGATPEDVFSLVRGLRDGTGSGPGPGPGQGPGLGPGPGLGLGLVAMVSQSIVERSGAESFIARAADAGFDGFIVPDIDLDSARRMSELAGALDRSFSMLIAPTSTPARMKTLVELSSGFVYLLARAGITGESGAAPEIEAQVEALRDLTDLPIAVGFGISTRAHVEAVTRSADAAIVGSALVRRMGEAADPVAAARLFVADLAAGLRHSASQEL